MKAFEEFEDKDPAFWAFIKFISEKLGYTVRKSDHQVKNYKVSEVKEICENFHTSAANSLVEQACYYSQLRADLLNNEVEKKLMSGDDARLEFLKLEQLYHQELYQCKLPLNKQKGNKRQTAYFTALINILAEKTIRKETGINYNCGFDDDPRSLMYVWDEKRNILGASSRRFDGAYPSIENPLIVWEIKEYYYSTSFGSRVADGVYETQLDGHEFKEIYNRTGRKIYHVLFVDGYRTWWIQGKSYLCRLIDAMNAGIVDEVIFGKEVLTRWPQILREVIISEESNKQLQ